MDLLFLKQIFARLEKQNLLFFFVHFLSLAMVQSLHEYADEVS